MVVTSSAPKLPLRTLAVALFVLALAGCSGGLGGGAEEVYLGKNAVEWEEAILEDARSGSTENFDRLVAGGADAVPVLMEQFRSDDLWTLRAARLALVAIGRPAVPPLAEILEDGTDEQARWAAFVIQRMGPEGIDAAPALAARMRRTLVRDRNEALGGEMRSALIHIGPGAIEHVVPLTDHRRTRKLAFEILAAYDLHAIPALEELKGSPNSETSRAAFQCAAEILSFHGVMDDNLRTWQRRRERERVGIVRDLLSTDEHFLSARRAEELGILDDSIDDALDRLQALIAGTNPVERRQAARALVSFGARTSLAAPLLVQTLEGEDDHLSWEIMRVLSEMGPAARDAVPVLVQFLDKQEDNTGQRFAAYTLSAIGVPTPDALESLERMIARRDTPLHDFGERIDTRRTAIFCLARVIPHEQAVPRLVELLDNDYWLIQRDAIEALALVGPPAVPAMRELLRDGTPQQRRNAVCVLMRIGKDSVIGLAALDAAPDVDDPLVVWAKAHARDLAGS